MSNYISLIVKRSKLGKIQEWIKSYSTDPSEVTFNKLTDETFIFFISKGAYECFYPQDNFLFKGYSIDHSNKSVVFGAEGKKKEITKFNKKNITDLTHLEGCYIQCRWSQQEIIYSNDAFSMCSMFYTAEPDVIAVSDSFYILSKLRKYLDLPNTPNEEVIIARSWHNTMSGQQLSSDTYIQQISYAPVTNILKIRIGSNLSLKVAQFNVSKLAIQEQKNNYEDEIRSSMKRIGSLVQTLASMSVNSVRIGLSGGFDSRVILSAALSSSITKEFAIFNCTNTSERHNQDYKIVKDLSDKFDFPLGLRNEKVFRTVKGQSVNSRHLWILANAGIYDFLYTPNYALKNAPIFQMGGFGAEIYKGMYGWRDIQRISNHIKDKEVAEAFKNQSQKGIYELGIEKECNIGSEWHYFGYRNAVHAGRSTITSMFGSRPLMQYQLLALSRSDINPFPNPTGNDINMISDMLIYGNPSLAKCNFDKLEKNLNHTYVDDRSKYLGKLKSCDLETYDIIGNVRQIHHGASEFFYNIVSDSENVFTLPIILEKMELGYEILPTSCKSHYEAKFNEIKDFMINKEPTIGSLGVYAGKLNGLAYIFD